MLRVNQLTGFWYSPSDLDVLGGAGLILGETAGIGIDFTYHTDITKQVKIRGTGAYYGSAYGKLTYTSPSVKMCRQSNGLWRYSNHNYCLQSQSFDSATWQTFNSATKGSANVAVAPDGTLTADAINLAAVTTSLVYQLNTGLPTLGVPYTISVWVMRNAGSDQVFRLRYDDTGGEVLTADLTATSSWQRFTFEINPVAGFSGGNVGIQTATTPTVAALLVWGFQVKRSPVQDAGGFTYATGYLATTSTAVFDMPYEWDIAGNSLGIKIEESKTNIFTQSQQPTWTPTGGSISSNTTNDPAGIATLDSFVENSASSIHDMYMGFITITANTTYTVSLFVKAAGRSRGRLAWVVGGSTDGLRADFDLSLGTITAPTAIGTGTATASGIEDVGGGIYRIWITGKVDAASTQGYVTFGLQDSSGNATYTGNGSSGIALGWGQIELGTFPTSPIHTAGAAVTVTRAPDTLAILPTLPISATAGTLVASIYPFAVDGGGGTRDRYLALTDVIDTDQATLYENNDFFTEGTAVAAGSNLAANNLGKIAAAWAVGDAAACVNAGTVGTGAPATAPTVDRMYIGKGVGGIFPMRGYMRQVTYLPRRATNLELQQRTNELGASVLLLNENDGMSFDFTYPTVTLQARIKDQTTPANNFNGAAQPKLSYTSPSVKMTRQSDGVWRYNNHNLALQSQTLGTTWTAEGVSVSSNAVAAPDGTSTADTLIENSAAGADHRVYQQITLGAKIVHTMSVFVKAGSGTRYAALVSLGGGGGNFMYAVFVLSGSGSVSQFSGGIDFSSSITSGANGWYRISITGSYDEANPYIILALSNSSTPTVGAAGHIQYNGDGSSSLTYWGAQIKRYPANDVGGFTPSTGYLPTTTTAAYDLPYEWSAAGVPQGILIEEQRTNLALQSQDLTTTWANGNSTEASNSTTAPDGTTTADTLIEDGNNQSHMVYQQITLAVNTNVALSVFAKPTGAGSTRYLAISLQGGGATIWASAIFNLSGAGTVTDTAVGAGSGTVVSTAISAEANGWYRCTIVCSVNAADPYVVVGMSDSATPTQDANLGQVVYVGDSTSSLYIWGAQAEVGAFPTSPIHTIGGTVTRVVDNIRLAASLFPISTTPTSTLIVSGISYWDRTAYAVELFKDTNNRVVLGFDTALTKPWFADGLGTWDMDLGTYTAGTVYKMAGAFQAADTVGVINGGSIVPDTTVTIPTTATELIVGGYGGNDNNRTNGHIRQITYLKRRASNLELQQKTQL